MTDSDGPLLSDTGRGLNVRYRGRNLYSPTTPIASAERRSLAYNIEAGTLVLVPSPLLFYGIGNLLEELPDDAHLLCVEADERLMRLSLNHAPATIFNHPAITYLRTESVHQVLNALHQLGIGRFRRALHLVVNGGSALRRNLYLTMFKAVEFEIQSHWRNRMTMMHLSHLWIKNFFRNLPIVARSRDIGTFRTGQPVIVAGAGESLEGALPLLQSMRGHYYLLSVDTSVRCLTDSGLTPDGIVVLDAQFANLSDLIGFESADVALFADVTACPQCLRRFGGGRWFFASEFALLQLFSRARRAGLMPERYPPLGSVGIAALYCALRLTKAPVVFAGLDFSYLPGKSHARGAPALTGSLQHRTRFTPGELYGTSLDRPHRETVDKRGRSVWTDNTLQSYSRTLDLLIESEDRVYDLGKTGVATPAPLLPDVDALREVLLGGKSGRPLPTEEEERQAGPRVDAAIQPGGRLVGAGAFLRAEHSRITSAAEAAVAVLEEGALQETRASTARRAIREVDYVYSHFPDSGEESLLSESFLKRFVEAADTTAVWVERSLARIE